MDQMYAYGHGSLLGELQLGAVWEVDVSFGSSLGRDAGVGSFQLGKWNRVELYQACLVPIRQGHESKTLTPARHPFIDA